MRSTLSACRLQSISPLYTRHGRPKRALAAAEATPRCAAPVAAGDWHHLGAEPLHALHVERLPLAIDLAHVDEARQADARTGRGGGDAVLSRAGLRDDPPRAEHPGEHRLAERVVDLVGPGVR